MILAANHQLLLNGSKINAECEMRNAKFEYQITNFEWIGEDTNHGQKEIRK